MQLPGESASPWFQPPRCRRFDFFLGPFRFNGGSVDPYERGERAAKGVRAPQIRSLPLESRLMKKSFMTVLMGGLLTVFGPVGAQAQVAGQRYQVPAGYEGYSAGSLINYGGF